MKQKFLTGYACWKMHRIQYFVERKGFATAIFCYVSDTIENLYFGCGRAGREFIINLEASATGREQEWN